MTRTKSTYLALLAILLSPVAANAGLITSGNTGASSPNHFVDFERLGVLANGEILTNQFAGDGLTFLANAGQAPVLFNNGFCNPTSSGGYNGRSAAVFGVSTGCGVRSSTSGSVLFDEVVAELSFLSITNNNMLFSFEALLNGVVVSSLSTSSPNPVPRRTTFLFSGSNFNELRFTQTGNLGNWFWMDDVAWRTTTQVPEPGTLVLFGIGLFGMGLARRNKKA